MTYDNEELTADECRIQYSLRPYLARLSSVGFDVAILGLIVQGVEIPASELSEDTYQDLADAVDDAIRTNGDLMATIKRELIESHLDEAADRQRKERLDTI